MYLWLGMLGVTTYAALKELEKRVRKLERIAERTGANP